jgi:hypothetical protein
LPPLGPAGISWPISVISESLRLPLGPAMLRLRLIGNSQLSAEGWDHVARW